MQTLFDAYKDTAKAFAGIRRDDGTPAITHPLRVWRTLQKYQLPEYVQIAGLLHDCLEDTTMTIESIKEKWGIKTAFLVYSVTKFNKQHYFEQIIDCAQEDYNVLFVKMADRIDNLQTSSCFDEKRKLKYYKETKVLQKIFSDNAHLIPTEYLRPFTQMYNLIIDLCEKKLK